jgi:haloalkane dehalogenase
MALAEPRERKGCWVFPGAIIGSSAWLSSLWEQRSALFGKNILLAWGMRDIAFREKELNQWISAFPHARVVRFSDAGHFVAEEKPVELAREMRALLDMVQSP